MFTLYLRSSAFGVLYEADNCFGLTTARPQSRESRSAPGPPFAVVTMADVEALLRAHPTLTKLPSGKLRDSLTGHEMPARVESIQSYITGSRYKKAREWYSKDYSKYEPFIVASKNSEKRLFCTLTRVEVRRHAECSSIRAVQRRASIHIQTPLSPPCPCFVHVHAAEQDPRGGAGPRGQ